ncbi:DUF4352 domain-containing protein [Lapidilactobacillus wuchangensis]|uniref:DUF4352 domain-containing protein n=1 Tax=Lapidilactobacillus wuchangensis TaxID=2486001 RepID=UPI000F7B7F05|nr:DUF4352 domain-containing protein [Lapidilactobacillus wuchangensis]
MKQPQKKKPIYQQLWLWLLILAFIIAGAWNSQRPKKSADSSQPKSTLMAKKKPVKKEFGKIGDSITVDKVTYTLNSLNKSDERNLFDDTQPKNVILVKYTVKNNTDKELLVGSDINIYGPDGKKLHSYASGQTLDTIAVGKSIDAYHHFGTENLGNFELQFAPTFSLAKPGKFKVNLQ